MMMSKYTVVEKKLPRIKAGLSEWRDQTAQWREKVINTSLEKFGVTHYNKTNVFTNSVVSANISKFGTTYPAQSAVGLNRIKKAYLKKYGTDNPSKVPEIRNIQTSIWVSNRYSPEALEFLSNDARFATHNTIR
jgi:hypothetical protein